jgi:hypothetical protein
MRSPAARAASGAPCRDRIRHSHRRHETRNIVVGDNQLVPSVSTLRIWPLSWYWRAGSARVQPREESRKRRATVRTRIIALIVAGRCGIPSLTAQAVPAHDTVNPCLARRHLPQRTLCRPASHLPGERQYDWMVRPRPVARLLGVAGCTSAPAETRSAPAATLSDRSTRRLQGAGPSDDGAVREGARVAQATRSASIIRLTSTWHFSAPG